MDPFTLAAVVVASAATQAYSAHKQRKADKKALQQQNEYNSPANQMLRLQQAGLNPNLVYGGGNVTGNQSGLLKQDYSRDADVLQNALSTYMAIDNHDKDMQMKGEEILDMQHKNDMFNATFEYQKAKARMENRVLQAQERMAQAQANIMEHDWNVIKGQTKTTSKETGFWPRIDRFFGNRERDLKSSYDYIQEHKLWN